ncbi:thrombospondin type 3 repeat-containing protein [Flavobacteriaceae bacterium GSB9]|nr:thrombospondin type 3 repeat-containing protein [Flavobacteriaceae bacterium GSB9]
MKHKLKPLYFYLIVYLFIMGCSNDSDPVKFNLTTKVVPPEAGSIFPESSNYNSGETVQITIEASKHYKFSNWIGDATGTISIINTVMDNDKSITAVFVKKDDDNDGIPNDIDTCPNTESNATVNKNGCSAMQIDSDGDNIWDAIDLCPFTATGFEVDTNGCALYQKDSDQDGVFDNYDLCPNTPIGEEVNLYGCAFSQIMFNPKLNYSQVIDIDGNTYKTTQIGTQTWMAENLRTTRYNNGNPIVTLSKPVNSKQTIGASIVYELKNENLKPYGRLYNYFTVKDVNEICPQGWHLPNKDEWTTLVNYLGGGHKAAIKLSERGNMHWKVNPNVSGIINFADNESGFSAVPSGIYGTASDDFGGLGWISSLWFVDKSNDITGYFSIAYHEASIVISNQDQLYRCIRCIKN